MNTEVYLTKNPYEDIELLNHAMLISMDADAIPTEACKVCYTKVEKRV
jgi:hypothetical protein